jgi:hypothetical protein
MFAFDAGAPYEFLPILDMRDLEPAVYGGHPALKLPVLQIGDQPLFGSENICRWLIAHAKTPRTVLWGEDLPGPDYANAQELVWQCMNAQVQIIMATRIFGLPVDQPYLDKLRTGMAGGLGWLDDQIDSLLERMPPHDISLLEHSLFCLFEHIRFRQTIEVELFTRIRQFADGIRPRPSAVATTFGD